MTNWLSVKEKLPENKEIVLAFTEENEMGVCRYDATEWNYFFMLFNTSYQMRHVTHWMPLPEPPTDDPTDFDNAASKAMKQYKGALDNLAKK